MEFEKAPAGLVEFIAEKVKNVNFEYRQMFGYPILLHQRQHVCRTFR
ncbi:MAG: hypothetical protein ACLQO7_07420 [Candidatus Bathyarchaeia archaeon]